MTKRRATRAMAEWRKRSECCLEGVQGKKTFLNTHATDHYLTDVALLANEFTEDLHTILLQRLTFGSCFIWSSSSSYVLNRFLDDLTPLRHILFRDVERRYESECVINRGC